VQVDQARHDNVIQQAVALGWGMAGMCFRSGENGDDAAVFDGDAVVFENLSGGFYREYPAGVDEGVNVDHAGMLAKRAGGKIAVIYRYNKKAPLVAGLSWC
jgi:hypothetical protein